MYSSDLRTRVIRILLDYDPDVLTRKSAAASTVGILADIMGQLCAVILRENGEATFNDCLLNIIEKIEAAARASAAAPAMPAPPKAMN
jgi:hypothetical protein